MIVIIDYKLGNLKSVLKAIHKIGHECITSSDPVEISSADKLILPGVGNFQKGIENIHNLGLYDVLNHLVLEREIPILGICLGMQLMTKNSEEGRQMGFGWLSANTKKFALTDSNLKIPHIGWNNVEKHKNEELFLGIDEKSFFYFVHSFFVDCDNKEDVLTTSHYGINFVSSFSKHNIFGCQFHPEKSHDVGLKLLNNFCNLSSTKAVK